MIFNKYFNELSTEIFFNSFGIIFPHVEKLNFLNVAALSMAYVD